MKNFLSFLQFNSEGIKMKIIIWKIGCFLWKNPGKNEETWNLVFFIKRLHFLLKVMPYNFFSQNKPEQNIVKLWKSILMKYNHYLLVILRVMFKVAVIILMKILYSSNIKYSKCLVEIDFCIIVWIVILDYWCAFISVDTFVSIDIIAILFIASFAKILANQLNVSWCLSSLESFLISGISRVSLAPYLKWCRCFDQRKNYCV